MGQNPRGAETLLVALGRVIRGEQKKNGWSIEKLAEVSGIPYGSLRKYIRGDEPIPFDRFVRLATVFELTSQQLMDAVDREATRLERGLPYD